MKDAGAFILRFLHLHLSRAWSMKYEQSYPVHSTAAVAQRHHVIIEIRFVMTENIKLLPISTKFQNCWDYFNVYTQEHKYR